MKKQIFKRTILVLLAVLLCMSSLNGCVRNGGETPTEPPKETFVQLLGFESYEEITGTKIRMGYMLGDMDINTDRQYITQGDGSLKVEVQGDYGIPTRHPYFTLDFLNTSCATCDFSGFKNISFDVYNDSDEDLHIRANINVGKEDGNFIGTAKETFTLKAKSWTTCTYDLSKMAGFSLYDFTSVRYLTIEFMEHKESREDIPHVFYIDNLIGNYFAEGEKPETVSFDFRQGIDFETVGKELLFTGQGREQDASFERVSYDALGIEAPENGGSYALRLSHETNYWPTFRINFGETLPAGTVISFVAYARIDGESLYNKSLFEFSAGGDATLEFQCDEWTQLNFTLKTSASYVDLFWNFDRAIITSGKASGEVFIDNVVATDPIPPVEPEGNLWEGLTFEIPGNAGLFDGLKIEGAERADATIERVAYADLDIPALSDGGEYALKLSHEYFYWPTFRIYFGEKLPAGTIITFQAYARITSGTNSYNQSIFEFRDGLGEATDQFKCDSWTQLEMKLPIDAEYIDLFWNYDRAGITSETAAAEVYIDNMIATPGKPPIKPVGDFLKGLDFEIIGNVGYFVGQGNDDTAAVIEWVSYDRAKIPALENGGTHLMKISHDSFYWPAFRVNFGRKLPAGTKITFMAYGTIQGDTLYDQSVFEFSGGYGDATTQFKCNQWTKLSITLPVATSFGDLFWNFDRAGIQSKHASGAVYIDNLIAEIPVDPEGDFYEGLTFEIPGNAAYFVGQGKVESDATIQRVAYADLDIPALPSGGEYALKISHDSFYWPAFRVNFGQELEAGTKITFMAYGTIKGETLYNQSIFEYNFTIDGNSYSMEATNQFLCDQWTKLSIVVPVNTTFGDLFWNFDRAGIISETASGAVYLDNVIATPPVEVTGDFLEGVDFETPGNELLFTEVGGDHAWRDATLDKVTYAQAGIPAPENGGSYALKLTCASSQWPVFRIEFGKTLPAGTTITFNAYTNDTSGIRNTVSSFHFLDTPDEDAAREYPHGSWSTQTITLKEDCSYIDLMCNMDRWNEPGPGNLEVYLDNFKAVEPADPVGDITAGIDFETEGNELYFTGIGAGQDATIERVSYADVNVTAPANGGNYALKVSHASNCWPTFRVNFGKTLTAGTTITFDVYGNYDYEAAAGVNKYVKLELTADSKNVAASADPNQVVWTLVETWKTGISITLTADCDHVDFFYNVADGQHGDVSSWLLIDNLKAGESAEEVQPTGDFVAGVDFETEGNELFFTGTGAGQDATIERVSYADVNVAAPANGGSYALKVSHTSNCWPTFRVNFGKTLTAGTTITFDVYGNYDYEAAAGVNKYVKLELSADSKSFATSDDPNQVVWTLVETWKTGISITLTADCDHVDFFYNVADGSHGDVSSWLLLDNFKAVEPAVEPNGDFVEGIGFETEGNELFFTGTGAGQDATIERVSYADVNVTAPANGGSYALKVNHANHCWPTFRVNFGKTLTAGTTITFDVYGNYDYEAAEGVYKYVKLELTADGKNVATSDDPNQVVWTLVETWKTGISITLTADCDHVDFFYNVADGQHGDVSSWLLLDNFKAVEPAVEPSGDFVEGIGFETEGNELLFTGTGADQDATIERVSYANVNVTAPANGGSYALKVSHANHCWPSFRVNFGKTLTAGTTITFDVYGNYDYEAAAGVYKYVKLELAANSKNVATSEDPNQVVWTLVETWKTGISITLTADCDYVDFFYNVADGSHGDVSSWLLLDNFKAVEPAVEPSGDFVEGIGFETEGNELLFTGTGADQDATIERVSYADANVTAPANGGSYALKVSHANHCWPSFRVNFGKTLTAGTTITFDVYGNYDYEAAEGVYKYVKLELSADSKSFATSDDPNQVVWTLVETWKTGISITLTADCDHVDFFYNVADGSHGEVASWLLLDNFKAEVPQVVTSIFKTGVGLENESDLLQFTGTGAAQDATIERVSYADANVAAPANGGSYALKVSHANHNWPSFRINFDTTLKAGTVITFDVYGNYDYEAAEGVYKYVKLELTADSKNVATSDDPNQVVWTLVETWKTGISITLTADCDHVDFFYNVADGSHGEVASWLLLDNFKAVEPAA